MQGGRVIARRRAVPASGGGNQGGTAGIPARPCLGDGLFYLEVVMKRFGPVLLKGVPRPFATSREVEWKDAVRDQLLAVWAGAHIEEPCQIRLRFFLPHEKAEQTDLDNLLKPAIDAIGSVLFKPARSGRQTVWNADDHWIYAFVATKEAVLDDSECRVEITLDAFEPGGVLSV